MKPLEHNNFGTIKKFMIKNYDVLLFIDFGWELSSLICYKKIGFCELFIWWKIKIKLSTAYPLRTTITDDFTNSLHRLLTLNIALNTAILWMFPALPSRNKEKDFYVLLKYLSIW